jgi:hypothetical protein
VQREDAMTTCIKIHEEEWLTDKPKIHKAVDYIVAKAT